MPPRIHIVGAGMAGLAAAVRLAGKGRPVTLYEASGHAGGRCRSLFDTEIGRTIDNGNHLLLSGNTAVNAYLRTIDAEERLVGPERAEFSFLDLATGERWSVQPGPGRIPWWVLSTHRRVPGTRLRDYLSAVRVYCAGRDTTVAQCLAGAGALYARFWEPLAVAVLNTEPENAAAQLLRPVLRETFGRGEHACRPRLAARGLAHCFVEPALTFLRQHGAEIRFHTRLRALPTADGRLTALGFGDGADVPVAPGEAVVLAVPPLVTASLLPGMITPRESRAIVNAHFRVAEKADQPRLLGLLGAVSQWLFLRDDVASVTVSAADQLAEKPADAIANLLWREVVAALPTAGTGGLPPHRIIKEKRATFAQTPAEVARRPGCRTMLRNLFLAGDWTDTGLPATIEGSVRSGNTAAASALAFSTTS